MIASAPFCFTHNLYYNFVMNTFQNFLYIFPIGPIICGPWSCTQTTNKTSSVKAHLQNHTYLQFVLPLSDVNWKGVRNPRDPK